MNETFHREEPVFSPEEEIRREIRAHLTVNDKGRPRPTMGNYEIILKNDPLFAGNIRRNLLIGHEDLTGDMPWRRDGSDLSDLDTNNILLFIEKHYDIRDDKTLHKVIDVVANEQRFHPVCELLESLVWDGTPRVRYALHRFLGAEVNDLNEEFLRVFMTGAVHRAFQPGCKFELMLCLIGGQGVGKSSFFRFLSMRDEWFSDDLRRLDDENVYRKLAGHWIIEMSEMIATANAKSIEEIKSFISRQKDTYKDLYKVRSKDRPRRCVFAGTTNRSDFLPKDRSGNRRFLPIRVDALNAEMHMRWYGGRDLKETEARVKRRTERSGRIPDFCRKSARTW